MRFRVSVLTALAVMILLVMFPIVTQAAEQATKPVLAKASTAATPLATSASTAAASAVAFEANYSDWSNRLKNARVKKATGKRFFIGGIGGGILVSTISGKSGSSGGAMLALLGAGAAAYGGYAMWAASETISDLDREAMVNGYYKVRTSDGFTIAPSDTGGIRAQVALSF